MNEHDLRRLADLADKSELIRESITPAGLALLEKYRRVHQPWWVKVWHWTGPMIHASSPAEAGEMYRALEAKAGAAKAHAHH